MTEVLFVLITIFVVYVTYKSARGKNQKPIPPRQVGAEQPVVSVISQPSPKKPVAVVETSKPQSASKTAKVALTKSVAVTKGKSVQELVGMTAGSIWNYLDKNGPTTVAKLARELPEEEKIIQRSIGWLAQEDKITLEIIDRAETISLK